MLCSLRTISVYVCLPGPPPALVRTQVATFLGPSLDALPPGRATPDTLRKHRYTDCLMPPEVLSARFASATVPPSSPTKCGVRYRPSDREAVDVWGMGTLVFELATARIAGKACSCSHIFINHNFRWILLWYPIVMFSFFLPLAARGGPHELS